MVSLQRIAIPLFLNSDKDKGFLFNFRQRHEALKNTDTRHFKIQTSNMGPQAPPSHPPHPWQGLCSRYQYFRVKRLKTDGHRTQSYQDTVVQIPFFLTTPSSSTYLAHHHHQHLHWLDQLAHCQDQLQTTDQQLCINNGHCKQIQAFTWTCSLPPSLPPSLTHSLTHQPTHPPTHSLTHSLTLFIQAGTQGQNQMTPLNPVLSFHLTCASPHVRPISSSLFITLLQQAPFAQKLDSAIHRINHYSVDKCLKNQLHHQADRDLSGR